MDEEAVLVDLEEAAGLKVECVLFLYISGIEIIFQQHGRMSLSRTAQQTISLSEFVSTLGGSEEILKTQEHNTQTEGKEKYILKKQKKEKVYMVHGSCHREKKSIMSGRDSLLRSFFSTSTSSALHPRARSFSFHVITAPQHSFTTVALPPSRTRISNKGTLCKLLFFFYLRPFVERVALKKSLRDGNPPIKIKLFGHFSQNVLFNSQK